MLRTSVMATHTEDHVDRAMAAFAEIARDGIVDEERERFLTVLQLSEPGATSPVP